MKVFISCDIEGVACVVHRDDTKLEGIEYERARHWMTAEANAAIEGAFEMGADEVVIADSHGHMRNLIADELNEKVLLVRGSPRPGSMMEGLDSSFDIAFLVGYHSMAGTPFGILAHTYLGAGIYSIKLNGVTVGEAEFNAAYGAHFGVPVGLVCGDNTLEAEVAKLMPWTERVVTKWGISNTCAKNLTPKASQQRIKAGAINAIKRLKEMKLFNVESPVRMEVEFLTPILAGLATDVPGTERIGGRTLVFTGKDMVEIMRVFRVACNAMLGEFFL